MFMDKQTEQWYMACIISRIRVCREKLVLFLELDKLIYLVTGLTVEVLKCVLSNELDLLFIITNFIFFL